MTNHEMLAFVYENGPCTWSDIESEFDCRGMDVAMCGSELMIAGFLEYDRHTATFRYAECVDG